jgi:hypothetical protein
MKCDLPRELLSGYLDEELNEEQLDWVKKHLAQCDACRKELEELKKLDEHLRSAAIEEPSREFVFKLNRQVMEKIRKRSRFSIFRFSPIFVPVAVAVLVLIVLINIPESSKPVDLDHRVLYSESEVRKDIDVKLPEASTARKMPLEKGIAVKKDKSVVEPSAPIVAKSKSYKAAEQEVAGGVYDRIDADEFMRTVSLEQIEIPDDRVVRAIIDTHGVVVRVATGNTIIPERDTMLENRLQGQQLKPAMVSGKKAQIYVDLTRMKETEECTTQQ